MPTQDEQIRAILDQVKEGVPVIYSGQRHGVRQIGTIAEAPNAPAVKPAVDAMLLSQRLAVEKISIGTLINDSRRFVVAHG